MNKENSVPFHLFHYHGSHYVIDIEGMQASAVDEPTARALEMLVAEPEMVLTSDMKKGLNKQGLISEAGDKSNKTIKTESFPIGYIALFLTQSCNLKCVYCYGDGGEYGTGGSMDEKTAFRAVDWLIEQSGKMKQINISFFGGEPFLKFSLMKAVVAYARKRAQETGKEVYFHANTNATLLDDDKIAFIKEQSISVMVSFDGPREIQDAQRPYANGKGSYDTALPKINKLLAALPETSGHAVIVGNTDPELIKDALQEIGFAEVSIVPASQSLLTREQDKIKSTRNLQNLLQALEQEAETWQRLIQSRDIEGLRSLMFKKNGLYKGLLSLFQNSKKRYACSAGRGMVGVSSSGDVYLCHRFVGQEKYKLGSIFGKSLNREEYQKSPTTENERCAACFAKYYCGGGCKYDNVSYGGSIASPSEDMCRLRCRELELAATVICSLEPEAQAFLIEKQILTPKPCLLDF